jgi:16S rRNA (adenine1518-N6/adenine1519-N6)-dimethyltransferase
MNNSINNTKNLIASNKIVPSKKMGQNFLVSDEFSSSLIDTIDFSFVDRIIEIGPGLGAITKFLIQKNIPLTIIELDKRLFEIIKNKFPKIDAVNNNCLKVDFDSLFAEQKHPIIVSNLPYSISTLIIIKFLEMKKIKTMYCMLQKEVVDRMNAKVRTKQYNNFSIICQYLSKIEVLKFVDRNNFYPIPQVDSLFIKIEKNELDFDYGFNDFIKFAFLHKRKTLVNNIKTKYETKEVLS